jgi:predicted aldo/keto reductase-like oxidoreductase
MLDRREFLRGSVTTGLATGLAGVSGLAAADEAPRVRRRVPLGRTGLSMSDVSFGSSRLRGEQDVVRHALDRGIDYFDTAESYGGGQSEETLGRALAGVRDRVTIASKTECGSSTRRDELMGALEGSLRRLATDRIDIYFNHAVNDVDRLRNDEWYEFATRARQQGKIRFTGMSGHGGHLVDCMEHAAEHGLVDVMLVAINYGQDPSFSQRFTASLDFVAVNPELPRALRKAHEKGIGVVAMKTLRGGRLNDLRAYETPSGTFAQAALRWVLAHPDVDALVVSMTSAAHIDEYLGASGWTRARAGDARLLAGYEARNGATQCQTGCSACESSCPRGVPISDVLRARMYAEDYGDAELAREAYAELASGAAACLSCAERSCTCPHGLAIPDLTSRTHRLLAPA